MSVYPGVALGVMYNVLEFSLNSVNRNRQVQFKSSSGILFSFFVFSPSFSFRFFSVFFYAGSPYYKMGDCERESLGELVNRRSPDRGLFLVP